VIDRPTIDKIMDAANIVDVVSEFVTLKKSGANYKGLCPFHNERTPSFYVSPARGICHCFSCGKGGNPVGFIMEHEQMTYPEALRWLAKKYNIQIAERELSEEEKKEASARESMFIVNEWAMEYFQNVLHHNEDGKAIGMQYFRSRGFRDDIIEKFHLGFALPQRDDMSKTALAKGYQPEFLTGTGLSIQREHGELVDKFSGRVMFPWLNVSGKVCAFGGRLLDSRTKGVVQKYVNSPDSEIYHKDHELYGIYQAKKAISKEDCVYMVEGYTDVIAMHQCGLENVVANSGTALSIHQIRLLHRFTSNIVLLYDGDEAGIHAAMRGTDMLLAEGMNIKTLLLPDNEDPDSFAGKHTAEDFKKYIEEHQTDFIEFKTTLMLRGVTDPIKRSEAISSIVRSVSVIPDQITRATYLHDCSQRLGMSEATLISTMNKFIRKDQEDKEKEVRREQEKEPEQEPVQRATISEQTSKVEDLLIQMVIRHGDEVAFPDIETEDGQHVALTVAQYIAGDLEADGLSFHHPMYNQILAEAEAHIGEDGFRSETYFAHHPDVEISKLATKMIVSRYQLSQKIQAKAEEMPLAEQVTHLIGDFKMDYLEARLQNLMQQIREAGQDMVKMKELMTEYRDMKTIRDNLAKMLGNNIIV